MKTVDNSGHGAFPFKGVLFVCRGNAVRSQMAEALFRGVAPEGTEVWSAGITPIGVLAPTKAVMKEVGLDLEGHTSKTVEAVPLDRIDLVVTLCEGLGDPCPNIEIRATRLHWPIPDPYLAAPAGKDGMDGFRAVRDGLKARIDALMSRPPDRRG